MLTISIVRMYLKYIYIAIYNIIIFFKEKIQRKNLRIQSNYYMAHVTRQVLII